MTGLPLRFCLLTLNSTQQITLQITLGVAWLQSAPLTGYSHSKF